MTTFLSILPMAVAGSGSLNIIDHITRSFAGLDQLGLFALGAMAVFVVYIAGTANRA